MARDFDSHRVAVIYRTARMAAKDAARLRSYGWRVVESDGYGGCGDPRVLLVTTYKPESLFGPMDLPDVDRRPTSVEPEPGPERLRWSHARRRWDHGMVAWSTDLSYGACGCERWRFETDDSLKGVESVMQPIGLDGKIFFGAATYTVERVNWPCRLADNRASVAVRTGDDEGWRGRSIMVAESFMVALLDLTSAQRQAYIETGEIPAVEDTYPVEGLA